MANGNTFDQRVLEAAIDEGNLEITEQLYEAGAGAGYEHDAIVAAMRWTAVQLDPAFDDYETWEATFLARLENPDKEER